MAFKPPPLYSVWQGMLNRCRNPNRASYKHYGERGISVCERWHNFQAFIDDMGPRPKGYSLERIDNNGNYEPGNCRWASQKEQVRNLRITRIVEIEGKRYKAVELSDISGIKTDTICERAAAGLSYEEVINPKRRVFRAGLAFGGKASGAKRKMKTHCPRGHEYAPGNLRASKLGYRACLTCHRERAAAKKR